MKTFGLVILSLCVYSGNVLAVDKPGRNMPTVNITGDNTSFLKVSVSSTSVSTLGSYSSNRAALTCINGDSTNAVYIGSSTAVTAGGSASFPLFAKQSISIANNAALFAIADTGVSSVSVYCLTEY